MISFQRMSLLI